MKNLTDWQYVVGQEYAEQAIKADPDLIDAWGFVQGEVDRSYAVHTLGLSYAQWLADNDDATRAKYPFHNDCGEGHDPQKISCEEVAEFIEADRAFYPG
jgi:hypothetical protein